MDDNMMERTPDGRATMRCDNGIYVLHLQGTELEMAQLNGHRRAVLPGDVKKKTHLGSEKLTDQMGFPDPSTTIDADELRLS